MQLFSAGLVGTQRRACWSRAALRGDERPPLLSWRRSGAQPPICAMRSNAAERSLRRRAKTSFKAALSEAGMFFVNARSANSICSVIVSSSARSAVMLMVRSRSITNPHTVSPAGKVRFSALRCQIAIGFASIACLGSGQHLGFLLRSYVDDDVSMAQAVV